MTDYYKSAIYNLDHITELSVKSNVELTLDYCKSSENNKLINSSYHTNSCIVNERGSSYMLSPFSNITLPKLDNEVLLREKMDILDSIDTVTLNTKYNIDMPNYCDCKIMKLVIVENNINIEHILVLLLTPNSLVVSRIENNKLVIKKTVNLLNNHNINRKLIIPDNPKQHFNYICIIHTENDNELQIVDLRDYLGETQLEIHKTKLYDEGNNIIESFENIYSYQDYIFITQPSAKQGNQLIKNNGFNVHTIVFKDQIFPPHIKYQSKWYGAFVKNLNFKNYSDYNEIQQNIFNYTPVSGPNKLFLIFAITLKKNTSFENRKLYKSWNFNENEEDNIYIVNLIDNNRDAELIKLNTVGINIHKYDDFQGFDTINILNNNIFIGNKKNIYYGNLVFKPENKNDEDTINGFFSIEYINQHNLKKINQDFINNDISIYDNKIIVPNYTKGLQIFNYDDNNKLLNKIQSFDTFSYYENDETDKGSFKTDVIQLNGKNLYICLDLYGGLYLLEDSDKIVEKKQYNKDYNSLQSSLIQNYLLPKNISCYHHVNNTCLHFDSTIIWYDDRIDLAVLYYPSHVYSGRVFPTLQVDNRINNEIYVTGMNSDNFINKTTLKGYFCANETTNIRLLSSTKYYGQVHDIYSSLISLSCDKFLGSMILNNHLQCLGITRSSHNNLVRSIPAFNIKFSIDKYLKSLNIGYLITNTDKPLSNISQLEGNDKIFVKGDPIKNIYKQITNIEFFIIDNREMIFVYKGSLNYEGTDTELKNNSYYKVFGYNNEEQIYLGVTQVLSTTIENWGKALPNENKYNNNGILNNQYMGYFMGRFSNDLFSYKNKINPNNNLNIYGMSKYRFEELKVNTIDLENNVLKFAHRNNGKMLGISICPVKQISKYLFRDIIIKNNFPNYFSPDVLEYYRNYQRSYDGYIILDINNKLNPSLVNLNKGDIIVSINDNNEIDKISNIVYTYQGNNNDNITIKYYRYNITELKWVENDIIVNLVDYNEQIKNVFI